MSVRATNWAWELGRAEVVKGGELLTLLRIADHADNNGVCWPGEESLAEYTGQDERTVRRHLKKLEGEDLKLLHRERQSSSQGRGRTFDQIHLHIDQPDKLSGEKSGVQPDIEEASTGQITPVQPDIDDTPLCREPSKEPSGTQTPVVPLPGDGSFEDEIFELWKRVTGRDPSTLFSAKRKRAIRARLKEGIGEDVIRRAVIGCGKSDWHIKRGAHAKRDGKPHTDLTLILRDPEHVEDFAKMAGGAATPRRAEREAILETEASRSAWSAAREVIRGQVPPSTFSIWIEPLEVVGEREGKLVLLDTSDGGVGKWVKRRYWSLILEATTEFDDIELVDQTQLELEDR